MAYASPTCMSYHNWGYTLPKFWPFQPPFTCKLHPTQLPLWLWSAPLPYKCYKTMINKPSLYRIGGKSIVGLILIHIPGCMPIYVNPNVGWAQLDPWGHEVWPHRGLKMFLVMGIMTDISPIFCLFWMLCQSGWAAPTECRGCWGLRGTKWGKVKLG